MKIDLIMSHVNGHQSRKKEVRDILSGRAATIDISFSEASHAGACCEIRDMPLLQICASRGTPAQRYPCRTVHDQRTHSNEGIVWQYVSVVTLRCHMSQGK